MGTRAHGSSKCLSGVEAGQQGLFNSEEDLTAPDGPASGSSVPIAPVPRVQDPTSLPQIPGDLPTPIETTRPQGFTSETELAKAVEPAPSEKKLPGSKAAKNNVLRRVQQNTGKAESQSSYSTLTDRELNKVPPESIGVEIEYGKKLTKKFLGLYKAELQDLTEEGARCVAERFRVIVIEKNKKLLCVGGYLALAVILRADKRPETIVVEKYKRKVTDEEIEKWAMIDFLFLPLILRLAKEEDQNSLEQLIDDDPEGIPNMFAQVDSAKLTRTQREDLHYRLLVEALDSPIGSQLINKPKTKEKLGELLRECKRTITNRAKNYKSHFLS